jgi:hypothetical protein
MTEPNFNLPITALVFAAFSTTVILVYSLIIINVYPQSMLQDEYVDTCKAVYLNPRKIVPESGNGPTVYIDIVSDQTWQAYLACVEAMPDKISPSLSEAIEVWRGLSSLVMALPSGEDRHLIDAVGMYLAIEFFYFLFHHPEH